MGILTIVKKFVSISCIIILGIVLRLIFINKPDGLWNDEYVSWSIAAVPFFDGFWNAVKSQCHMPFYYLYLKFFMSLFGQSDLVLRLTSVLAGVLSIGAMYFVGKEKDEKTGLICAGLTSISAFLIYYSQEVRFYSILFFFSAMALLFTIRCLKSPSRKNLIVFVVSSFLILFTHTIGFVFVFFNLLFLSIALFSKFKKQIIILWSTICVCGIALCPLILKIFGTQSFSQWWGHFSVSKIGFLLTDYFSPVITNLTNAPDNFFYAPQNLIFMLIPVGIAVYGIYLACRKDKKNSLLFSIALCFLVVLFGASIAGKLVFTTKYSMECYPILIYLACYGISTIENDVLQKTLIGIFCLINLGYVAFAPYSAPKMYRAEGNKIPMDILKQFDLKQGDTIVLQYYPASRFEKYFDFSKYNVVEMHKGNFVDYLSSDITYTDAYKNGKELYKPIFSKEENPYFTGMVQDTVFDNLRSGHSVALVILNSVAFLSPEKFQQVMADDNLYKKEPLLFLVFSYLRKQTIDEMLKTLALTNVSQKGNWTVVQFTKLNK